MSTALRRMSLLLMTVVSLTACGGTDDAGTVGNSPDAGGDTTLGVPADGGLTVPEALETDATGPLTVQGLLIDDSSDVRLCEAALESYPPQCGGASIEVQGVEVTSIEGATTEGDVTWVDQATLTGGLEDDVLIVSDTTQG